MAFKIKCDCARTIQSFRIVIVFGRILKVLYIYLSTTVIMKTYVKLSSIHLSVSCDVSILIGW
jgi:hypothetical protein